MAKLKSTLLILIFNLVTDGCISVVELLSWCVLKVHECRVASKAEVLKENVSTKQYADQSIDAPVYSSPVLKPGMDYWKSSPGSPCRYRPGLTNGNREYRLKFVNVDGRGRSYSNLTACAEAGDAYFVSCKQQNRMLETLPPAATAL